MRNKLRFALATSLLFVGAGCAANVQQDDATDVNANAAMKGDLGAPVDIDAEVDTILKASDEEKTAEREMESDASEVGSDGAEIDAMIEGTYEIK